jgi:hypothetical protein
MKNTLLVRSAVLGFLVFAACATKRPTEAPGPTDQSEFEDLKAFYEKLKEGQSRSEVEKSLAKKHELICEGNSPGPQRCVVKFRVAAGEDFGADRLGLQIKNANVRDEYRVLSLDFRNKKLVRWESRSEVIRR